MRPHFRFEDLEIWQMSVKLAVQRHRLAAQIERRRYYRYAEQLRGAGMSLPNNIAEGSGSIHPAEFTNFLNISRRSLFEDASMLLVCRSLDLVTTEDIDSLLYDCDLLSRKITKFGRSL